MKLLYKKIPSMHEILVSLETYPELMQYPRVLIKYAVESFLENIRSEIRSEKLTTEEALQARITKECIAKYTLRAVLPHFRRILNGTGVVLHTNAGRALLAEEATLAVTEACKYYSNLELNLQTGERGSRYSHIEELLCTLTGAEGALVVNNNAAAVLLILDSFCKGKEVIASRGQLVEIGGSFRIPDVMAKSGAILKEVGTTNRTHLRDYEEAITEHTSALIRIHTSNFKVIGFTSTVSLEDLVMLGKHHNIPVIEDLGSGFLLPLTEYGLSEEPTVQQTVSSGVDIVSFSGDKVLGGPQAGIIVGKKEYIDILKKNQLTRALRIDKMTIAALEATLRLYLVPEIALQKIPTLSMLTAPLAYLEKKAQELQKSLLSLGTEAIRIEYVESFSKVGGGSFPEEELPTYSVRITCLRLSALELKERLLQTTLPLLVRLENNTVLIDVRTLIYDEIPLVVATIQEALAEHL